MFSQSENSDDDSKSSSILTQPTENISRKEPTLDSSNCENSNHKGLPESENHVVSTKAGHNVYIPSWYKEVISSNRDLGILDEEMRNRCWMTDELATEIRKYYPSTDEIMFNKSIGDCTRDHEAFHKKCSELFPEGRVFLSYIQLNQAAKHFLDGWYIKGSFGNMRVSCFYSNVRKSTYTSTCDPSKKRKTKPSLKQQYQCPFQLRYNFLEKKGSDEELPNSFWKVKLTTCQYDHSCQLSNIFYKTAKRQSRGTAKIDLASMTSLLMLLKANPTTSANALRPLLLEYIHHDVPLDSTYIRNFRQRVAYFHAKNPDFKELSISEASTLLDKSPITNEERKILDDPIIRINFNDMLLKIMSEGSSTWEALAFLKRCKKEIPGFDFRIRLNENNHPCALVFTTLDGRLNAIKYGELVTIDMQHRQHNNQNWPYFAPVIKDMDMKIGVLCEAMVISEDVDAYAWVFKKMVEMEPRFDLKKIKYIFADQRITNVLLHDLGISETCLLRGDYYHLTNEVWPQPHNFGPVYMAQIGPFLRQMLLSRSEEQFDQCYADAKKYLINDPDKLKKLDVIKNNPSYYAGYYLRQYRGNIGVNGDASSEQNHASIVAHLGNSANGWSIMDHICHLVKRQAEHTKIKKKRDDEWHCRAHGYTSKEIGQRGVDDTAAKKALSSYAYNELYTRAAKYACFLTSEVEPDGSVTVWKAGEDKNESKVWKITIGGRCSCQKNIDFDFQCGHELVADKKFLISKYNIRWLNNNYYFVHYPENSPYNFTFFPTTPDDNDVELDTLPSSTNDNNYINEMQSFQAALSEVHACDSISKTKITYSDLVQKLSELARTVQFNQEHCITVMSDIDKMIQHY